MKSSPKTFSEKLSGPLSMLEWQGPLIGTSPGLILRDFVKKFQAYNSASMILPDEHGVDF